MNYLATSLTQAIRQTTGTKTDWREWFEEITMTFLVTLATSAGMKAGEVIVEKLSKTKRVRKPDDKRKKRKAKRKPRKR